MQQKIEESFLASALVAGADTARGGGCPQTTNAHWFVVEATENGGDKAQLALAGVCSHD